MLTNIVALQAPQKTNISTIKNIETIILRVVIVQILLHKFFLKVVNSKKILPGTMTKMVQQDLGSMRMVLKDIWNIVVEPQ